MCWWALHYRPLLLLMYLSRDNYLSFAVNVASCFWCPDSFSPPTPCEPLIIDVGFHKTAVQRLLPSTHEAEVSWRWYYFRSAAQLWRSEMNTRNVRAVTVVFAAVVPASGCQLPQQWACHQRNGTADRFKQ
jgi:hypothetical protein